jgi:hypothetical protein
MPIKAIFRKSDAEQRSYGWFQRLRLGRLLFGYEPERYRKIGRLHDSFKGNNVYDNLTPWQKALADANHVVYDNLPLKTYYQAQSNELAEEGTTTSLTTNEGIDELRDPLKPKSQFITAGWWNPLAFLEFITLAWANWATDRLDPLKDSGASKFGSYVHITVASGFNALFKTVNQVFTPLTAVLLGLAALNYSSGVLLLGPIQLPTLALWGLGAALLIIPGLMHYPLYKKYLDDNHGAYQPELRAIGRSLGHVLESLVIGVLNPVFRLVQKAYFLAKSHPKIALTTAVVATLAVVSLIALPLIPGVHSALHFGKSLGSTLGQIWSPATSGLGLSALGKSLFEIALVAAATLGIVDLVTRTGKSVAEIIDDRDAQKNVQFEARTIIDFGDTCAEKPHNIVVKAFKRDEPCSISEQREEPHKAYTFLQYDKNYGNNDAKKKSWISNQQNNNNYNNTNKR